MRRRGYKKGPQQHAGENRLVLMLDEGRLAYFRYDAKQIFKRFDLDPKVSQPLLASIVSRGTRNGIEEARDYVKAKEEEGAITEDVSVVLLKLIGRYKKWR